MNGPGDYEWLRRGSGRGSAQRAVSLMSLVDAAPQPFVWWVTEQACVRAGVGSYGSDVTGGIVLRRYLSR